MNVGTYNNNCSGVYSGSPDCYTNSGYDHYQYHHHHYYQDQVYPAEYCGTSNRIEPLPKQYNNVGYYDSMLGYSDYSNNSTDLNDFRREDSHYYPLSHQSHHQHYHQDDVNIITSANGLSYTNLDYTTTSENYSYHHKTPPKEYVNYETIDAKRTEADQHPRRHDDCHENIDYLQQSAITDEHYQNNYTPSSVKEEPHYHQHTAASSAINPLPDYHHQSIPIHHIHQNAHHHHQSQHVNPTATTAQTNVPTYKWMQVKRNVPKPGEFSRFIFLGFFFNLLLWLWRNFQDVYEYEIKFLGE